MLSKSLNNQPVQMQKLNLRQKENLINSLKNEINEEKEKSKLERQRLEKRISFMLQDYNKIKEALE